MLYIVDLHYSHKDPSVIALMTANNIIPVFIPAGCTDLHQVCDVVINKSYKNGVNAAFIDYVSTEFNLWQESEKDDDDIFEINLAISVMKPLIPAYVLRGIQALKTDAMKGLLILLN